VSSRAPDNRAQTSADQRPDPHDFNPSVCTSGTRTAARYRPEVPGRRDNGGMHLRSIERSDRERWAVLWDGYNAFYGRNGPTPLPTEVTELTWNRFFDETEPVRCIVADDNGELAGVVHFVFIAARHDQLMSATSKIYLRPQHSVDAGSVVP
jgi:hypothetical protein